MTEINQRPAPSSMAAPPADPHVPAFMVLAFGTETRGRVLEDVSP
jgi:hypothetical protein